MSEEGGPCGAGPGVGGDGDEPPKNPKLPAPLVGAAMAVGTALAEAAVTLVAAGVICRQERGRIEASWDRLAKQAFKSAWAQHEKRGAAEVRGNG